MKIALVLASVVFSLTAQEPETNLPVTQDVVGEYVEETFFCGPIKQGMKQLAIMLSSQENKKFPGDAEFLESYEQKLREEPWISRFKNIYSSRFSEQEIATLLEYRRSEIAKKEMELSRDVGLEIMQLNCELLTSIVSQYPEESASEEGEEVPFCELDSANFLEEVQNSELPIAIKVYSSHCPPCKAMTPIFSSLASEYKGVYKFAAVNVDNARNLIEEYGITALPTVLFMRNGQVEKKCIGLQSLDDLRSVMETLLKEDLQSEETFEQTLE